jgi:hypothetical protein
MTTPQRTRKRFGSRAKGASGELEACEALDAIGLEARRTVQYSGRAGTADVVCEYAPGLHIEVKRTERLNPYAFMDQAIRDSTAAKRTPLVVCRSSYKPWLIVCRVQDLPRIAQEVLDARRLSTPAAGDASDGRPQQDGA